ncbi:MAG: hypothetical protein JXA71_19495 [Chitinispirillaceae bacterium]|nr:hypothetical protein [Chitinispirillaceae bacterium]
MREKFESYLSAIKPEDMPTSDLRDIAKEFGVTMALKMVKEFGGSIFYIPKLERFKAQIELFIKENYNGHNSRELANACGVSIRYVYSILAQENSNKSGVKTYQESLLFDGVVK